MHTESKQAFTDDTNATLVQRGNRTRATWRGLTWLPTPLG